MEQIIRQIIDSNYELFKEYNIQKINSGFTNLVFSAGDKYIIKVCNNKNNEERFKNEIKFYLKNKDNKYIPNLYKYYLSENENDYSYEILEKINGQSLYYVWHLFHEEKREQIVKEISEMMKSFHSIECEPYDWASFINGKLKKDFEKCNEKNLFNIDEQKKIEYIINNSSKYLDSSYFGLVHSDVHFDNILLTEKEELKLIDFETTISAPTDYELDIFIRMCNNPLKYSSEETENLINIEDYINIPKYFKKYYPEIFNINYFDIRHLIYDLEANFRLLARFPENDELKEIVIDITNKLLNLMK